MAQNRPVIFDPNIFDFPEMRDEIDEINNPARRYRWIGQPLWPYKKQFKTNMRRTFLSARDKTNRRKLIEALVHPTSSNELRIIGYEILTCCPSFRCRSPLCNYCRTKMQNSYEDRMLRYFKNSNHDDLYWLTILSDVTYNPIDDVALELEMLKDKLRRRFQHPKLSKNISAFGAIEIDVKHPDQFSDNLLARKMMKEYQLINNGQVAYMPHMHLVVDLKEISAVDFRKHLTDKFSKMKQITLSPLRKSNSKEHNLSTLARYCFKFRYQFSNNILRAKSSYGVRFDDDTLREYTQVIHSIKGQNGVVGCEFRYNL